MIWIYNRLVVLLGCIWSTINLLALPYTYGETIMQAMKLT